MVASTSHPKKTTSVCPSLFLSSSWGLEFRYDGWASNCHCGIIAQESPHPRYDDYPEGDLILGILMTL